MRDIFTKVFPIEAPLGFHVKGHGTGYYLVPMNNGDRFVDGGVRGVNVFESQKLRAVIKYFLTCGIANQLVKQKSNSFYVMEVIEMLLSQFPFASAHLFSEVLNDLANRKLLRSSSVATKMLTDKLQLFDNQVSLAVSETAATTEVVTVRTPQSLVVWDGQDELLQYAEDYRFLERVGHGDIIHNKISKTLQEMFDIRDVEHVRIVGELNFILGLFNSNMYLTKEEFDNKFFTDFCKENYRRVFSYYLDKLKDFYVGESDIARTAGHREVLSFIASLPLHAADNGYGLRRVANEQAQALYLKDLDEIAQTVLRSGKHFVEVDARHVSNFSSLVMDLELRYRIKTDYVVPIKQVMQLVNPEVEYGGVVELAAKTKEWLLGIRTGTISSSTTLREFYGRPIGVDEARTIIKQSAGLMKALNFGSSDWSRAPHLTAVYASLPDVQFTTNFATHYDL